MNTNSLPNMVGLLALLCFTYSCSKELDEVYIVSFENDLKPVLAMSCSNGYCHANYFQKYNNLKLVADNGELLKRVIVEESMPPTEIENIQEANPITREQRLLFESWIKDGAKNN